MSNFNMSAGVLAAAAAAAAALLVPGLAGAQSWDEKPAQGVAALQRSFGGAGLLAEWSNNETFGVVQSRGNLQYAHETSASSGGMGNGYRDDVSSLVVPLSGLWELPDRKSFIWVNAGKTFGDAEPNPTYSRPDLGTLTVEYLHMVDENTVWGIGVMLDRGTTELLHNGGTTESWASGLRADLLHRFSPHWGIAARAVILDGKTRTTVPLGFADLRIEQDRRRYYLQADLVGNFTDADADFLPRGWVMNPIIGIAAQRTKRGATTTSLGESVAAETDDYNLLSTTVRFSKPTYQPRKWGPSIELGFEHELDNDLGHYADEPTYAYGKIGAGILLDPKTYFNISYARSQGLNGHRRNEAVTLVLSRNF